MWRACICHSSNMFINAILFHRNGCDQSSTFAFFPFSGGWSRLLLCARNELADYPIQHVNRKSANHAAFCANKMGENLVSERLRALAQGE